MKTIAKVTKKSMEISLPADMNGAEKIRDIIMRHFPFNAWEVSEAISQAYYASRAALPDFSFWEVFRMLDNAAAKPTDYIDHALERYLTFKLGSLSISHDHKDIIARLEEIGKKMAGVPVLVHENKTFEGQAFLRTAAMINAFGVTEEERAVYIAWFNNGGKSRSQSEVARETKFHKEKVRRLASRLNKKTGKDLILWNTHLQRDNTPQARDIVNATK